MAYRLRSRIRAAAQLSTPRTLEELTALVEVQEDVSLEASVQANPWAAAFSQRMAKDQHLNNMFLYLVLVSSLAKASPSKLLTLLQDIRTRFFNDSQFWIPVINFRDTEGHVEDIFRLFESESFAQSLSRQGQPHLHPVFDPLDPTHALKTKLSSLSQDKVIRTELEPVFRDFIKRKNLHPTTSVIQQCIMSIL